jgi:hypothetical protein
MHVHMCVCMYVMGSLGSKCMAFGILLLYACMCACV